MTLILARREMRWAFLCLLMALAALLRLFDLERMLVWHDEVFTAIRVFGFDQAAVREVIFSGQPLTPADVLRFQQMPAQQGWWETLVSLATHPEHSPGYYLLARAFAGWIDAPWLALRAASATVSVILVPAMYLVTARLFKSSLAGLLAAALVVVSPLQLLYAQEAREYSLWCVTTALSSALLIGWLEERRQRYWVLYALLLALGLYSHLLFVGVIAAHAIYAVWWCYKNQVALWPVLRGGLGACAIAGLLFLPWVIFSLESHQAVTSVTAWMTRPVEMYRIWLVWATHLVHTFVDVPLPGYWIAVLSPFVVYLVYVFIRTAPLEARMFVLLLSAVFIAAVLVQDLLFGGIRSEHPRYAFPVFLALQIACAGVFRRYWKYLHARLIFTAVLLAGLLSDGWILSSNSWWSKNFSADNANVAALMNADAKPLLLLSETGVSLGEMLSVVREAEPGLTIVGVPDGGFYQPAADQSVYVLTPGQSLRDQLETSGTLEPLRDSWQWLRWTPAVN